eukprot:c7833_g1_i2.p1 GENE.c7833_g1_i2~~c7833_g1_i2.p1  ORF type:complete len:170 (+),score=47.04 c7833_g1_i2:1-510(+)
MGGVDDSGQYKSNLMSLLNSSMRGGQTRVDLQSIPPTLLHKQLQHLHRKPNSSAQPNAKSAKKDGDDPKPVDDSEHDQPSESVMGLNYSSEMLRLILNAAGREGGDHDPEIDPFSMEEGDHAFVENLPDGKRASRDLDGHEQHGFERGREKESAQTSAQSSTQSDHKLS